MQWMCGSWAAEMVRMCSVLELLTRHQRGAKWPADSTSHLPPEYGSLDTKYGRRIRSVPHM